MRAGLGLSLAALLLTRASAHPPRRVYNHPRIPGVSPLPPLRVRDTPGSANCTTFFFRQRVDHFSWTAPPSGDGYWQQRYMVYDKFWKPNGGAIFFYTVCAAACCCGPPSRCSRARTLTPPLIAPRARATRGRSRTTPTTQARCGSTPSLPVRCWFLQSERVARTAAPQPLRFSLSRARARARCETQHPAAHRRPRCSARRAQAPLLRRVAALWRGVWPVHVLPDARPGAGRLRGAAL